MKILTALSLTLLTVLSHSAQASHTQAEAKEVYERVSAAEELADWTCSTAHAKLGNRAVVMFNTGACTLKEYAYTKVLTIRSPDVCNALHVVCPFVAKVTAGTHNLAMSAKSGYWATQGMYEDTVMFVSDNAGMKLINVANGSQVRARPEFNWFFGPGECTARRNY